MKNISILVKSGTGGYYDYDNCDLRLKTIEYDDFTIPRIGETIRILEDNDSGRISEITKEPVQEMHKYLVRDIEHWIADENHGIDIYVVPIGRSVKYVE